MNLTLPGTIFDERLKRAGLASKNDIAAFLKRHISIKNK